MAAKKKESPTKSTPKKPAPPPDIPVRVDAKLTKAYDSLVAVISSSAHTEMEDFDRRWEAAAAILDHDPPLYVFGGHRDQDEFFRKVMKEEPRTARRYVRVGKFASPRDEETYGVAQLDAALGYIEAKLGKPLAHPPLPVALDKLRIPTPEGTKSIETATIEQIAAATTKLKGAASRRPSTATEKALKAKLGGVASLKRVEVNERNGFVSFVGVPVAAIDRFARAVLATKLP